MRALSKDEIAILQRHAQWLCGENGGEKADLSGADLHSADLRSANLSWANLYCADLRSANLSWANLYCADLRSANLSSADLSGANLSSADLSWANLYCADLRGADLRRADLSGADHIFVVGPIGSRKDITYAVFQKDGIRVKCGCFWGSFADWEEKCRAVHGESANGKAYAAAADFIRACADAYWTEQE